MKQFTLFTDELIYCTAKLLNTRFLQSWKPIEEEYEFKDIWKRQIYFWKEASEKLKELTWLLTEWCKLNHNMQLEDDRIIVFDTLISDIITTNKIFQ